MKHRTETETETKSENQETLPLCQSQKEKKLKRIKENFLFRNEKKEKKLACKQEW